MLHVFVKGGDVVTFLRKIDDTDDQLMPLKASVLKTPDIEGCSEEITPICTPVRIVGVVRWADALESGDAIPLPVLRSGNGNQDKVTNLNGQDCLLNGIVPECNVPKN